MTQTTTRRRLALHWCIALALLIVAGVLAAVFIVMTAERMIWNARVNAAWKEWTAVHPVSWPVYSDDLVKFSEQGPRVYERRYGYKNRNGEIVIPAQFTYVSERFRMGRAAASDENGNSGHIDTTGAWGILPRDDIVLFDFLSEGVAEIRQRGLYDWYYIGFVRTDDSVAISLKYTLRRDFRNGVVLLGPRQADSSRMEPYR